MFVPIRIVITNLLSFEQQLFEFRRGEAVLLVGNNLDDSGQKGNGSGKSSINEAISLAITGSSIRDVKSRELVRDGEESAEIYLLLNNTQTNETFEIYRQLFSKESKSSTCTLMENGNGVTTCADINDYNKYILNKIGISKEDFFNFYLITKEQYTPFLSTGDVKKKEIINRFSGANKIDKVDEFIDEDSDKKGEEIDEQNSKLSSVRGKIELFKEQIEKEKLSSSEAEKQKKIDVIKSEMEQLENLNSVNQTNLVQYTSNLKGKKEELSSLQKGKPDFEKTIELLKEVEQNLQIETSGKTEESKKVPEKYTAEIDAIKAVETECNKEIRENRELLTQKETEKQQLENRIAGAITCPKCSHEFTLQYKDFDVDLAKTQVSGLTVKIKELVDVIEEYKSVLIDLEKDKESVNNKIISDRESIKKELENINKKTLENNLRIREIQEQRGTYNTLELNLLSDIESLENQISLLEKKEVVNKELITGCKDRIEKLNTIDDSRLKSLQKELEWEEDLQVALTSKIQTLTEEKQKIDEWYGNFKAFKSYLANQSIRDITDYTNLFLNAMGSNLTINMEGYRLLSGGKKLKEEITTTVFKDGFEKGSYGKLSAGERGRIELSVILGMQNLINLNTKTGGLDLLVCDEILDSVDSLGLENIINSLQGIDSTIMIVSQNDINSLKENMLVVEKHNGVSVIKTEK